MPFKELVENGTIYLEPAKHERTLVWLHGLGDTAQGFKPFFMSLEPLSKSVRVVLPTAPMRPCKLAGGATVNSWFDIGSLKDLDLTKFVDEKQARESQQVINMHLRQAVDALGDPSKVFVGGFSQGCAMALLSGLEFEHKIGGVIGCSGFYFPFAQNRQTDLRVRVFHGDRDMTIPLFLAQISYGILEGRGVRTNFEVIPGLAHEIAIEEEDALKKELQCA